MSESSPPPALTAVCLSPTVGCGVFVDLNHPEESTRLEAVKQLMTALRKDQVKPVCFGGCRKTNELFALVRSECLGAK